MKPWGFGRPTKTIHPLTSRPHVLHLGSWFAPRVKELLGFYAAEGGGKVTCLAFFFCSLNGWNLKRLAFEKQGLTIKKVNGLQWLTALYHLLTLEVVGSSLRSILLKVVFAEASWELRGVAPGTGVFQETARTKIVAGSSKSKKQG